MKKILSLLLLSLIFVVNFTYAIKAPILNCVGLPGCPDTNKASPTTPVVRDDFADNVAGVFVIDFIKLFIQYIGVIAVISLILAGIMYTFSGGEDEKVKKVKNWIIWSLAGVFFSISAWGIIKFIFELNIN